MSKGWIYLAETCGSPVRVLSYGLFEEANPNVSELNNHIQKRFRRTKEKPRISYAIYCNKVKDAHEALRRNKVLSKNDLVSKFEIISKTLDIEVYQKINPSLNFSDFVSSIKKDFDDKDSVISRSKPYMYLFWFSWPIPAFFYYLYARTQEDESAIESRPLSDPSNFSISEFLGTLFGLAMLLPIIIIVLWGVFILGPGWFLSERKDNKRRSIEIREKYNDRIREVGQNNFRTTAEINAVLLK